jgi:predicted NUDIX family NTP pyrophosphohydrolase
MAPKRSAGILLYRHAKDELQVLIAHMGGPFWARKDAGAWTIPKGEYGDDEDALEAACREFAEELGQDLATRDLLLRGEVKQSGGKTVVAWAAEGDLEPPGDRTNPFTTEWPRGSGRMQEFPEIDRAEWLSIEVAHHKLVRAQAAFLDRLVAALNAR